MHNNHSTLSPRAYSIDALACSYGVEYLLVEYRLSVRECCVVVEKYQANLKVGLVVIWGFSMWDACGGRNSMSI